MTTEDDFQAALDADPTDWQTRLVLADWLDERGDPRAEGYRALGLLRKRPRMEWYEHGVKRAKMRHWVWRKFLTSATIPDLNYDCLNGDWRDLIPDINEINSYRTRREAEDAAARAFAKLPAARRTELLATEPTVTA
jgi:uncharacterized protein (TIGR02996 family)